MTTPASSPIRGLYGITPEWDDTGRLLHAVEAAARGGLAVVQLRRKDAGAAKRREQALALRELCTRLRVALIVNDDWRLALDVGADGVHLGRDDGDIAAARQACGPGFLIGASCYDRVDLAVAALAAGADHVAFGAVFDSPTKPAAVRAPLSSLAEARSLRMPAGAVRLGLPSGPSTGTESPSQHSVTIRPPIVAIGGISPGNAALATAAGADALAVITALFEAANIEAAARAFCRAFDAAPFVQPSDSKAVP